MAQMPGAGSGRGFPSRVDADQAIEWHQEQKAYVARGNAVAKRGEVTITGDTLVAYYRDIPAGGTEIFRLAADGKVHIFSPTQNVYGDRAVYDVDKPVAVVTGTNLRLITPTEVVTARDSLEYWETQKLAVARGDAVAVREQNRRNADDLVACSPTVRTEASALARSPPCPPRRRRHARARRREAPGTGRHRPGGSLWQCGGPHRDGGGVRGGAAAFSSPATGGIARLFERKYSITRGDNQLNGHAKRS